MGNPDIKGIAQPVPVVRITPQHCRVTTFAGQHFFEHEDGRLIDQLAGVTAARGYRHGTKRPGIARAPGVKRLIKHHTTANK